MSDIIESVKEAKELCKMYMEFQTDIFVVQYALDYYKVILGYINNLPYEISKIPEIQQFKQKEITNIQFNIALANWFMSKYTTNKNDVQNKYEQSKKFLNQILESTPTHIKAIALKAKIFIEQGYDEKAKEFLQQLKTLDEQNEVFQDPKCMQILNNQKPMDFFTRLRRLEEIEESESIKSKDQKDIDKTTYEEIEKQKAEICEEWNEAEKEETKGE